jgi:serine/threonine protein kinase
MVLDVQDPLLGKMVDSRFQVIAKLGHGGMGAVYRARQTSIGRDIALKVLDARFENDEAAVKRFYREAKLASTLQHPNTVGIIDFGQNADGRLYLAMELVRGRTLFEEMDQKGPLPLARIATIGAQLCDALDVAHGKQIVHRDLKLENVMLIDGDRDHIKILDFGLALMLSDPHMRATKTGMISGTPRYMPPEVAFEAATPAPPQDMYAVGVILGELALGKPMWTAPTVEALFMKKMSVDDKTLAGLPTSLRNLVRSLLAEKPAARPTAADTLRALRQLDGAAPEKRRAEAAATEPPPLAADAFDISADKLVDLDGRAAAPGAPMQSVVVRPPADVRHAELPDDPFAPPKLVEPKLEIADKKWIEKREQLQEAAANPKPEKKPFPWRKLRTPLLLLVVGGGIAGATWYATRPRESKDPQGHGANVEIVIDSNSARPVSLDGKFVGKTPLRLEIKRSDKPILVTTPNLEGRQVIPDHDQRVDLNP